MTIKVTITSTSVEVERIEDLPAALQTVSEQFGNRGEVVVGGAQDPAVLVAALRERGQQMQASLPGPRPSDGAYAGPHANVVAELRSDPRKKDVVDLLIVPLLERKLEVRGSANVVLGNVALAFKPWTQDKLKRTCAWLLKGKHKLFPDHEEIHAAASRAMSGEPVNSRGTMTDESEGEAA